MDKNNRKKMVGATVDSNEIAVWSRLRSDGGDEAVSELRS